MPHVLPQMFEWSHNAIYTDELKLVPEFEYFGRKRKPQRNKPAEYDPSPLFSRRGHWRRLFDAAFSCYGGDDFPAVEPPILDEDFRRVFAPNHHSRDVNPRHVGFKGLGIGLRPERLRIQSDSLPLEKPEIGVVTGHGKHLIGR